MPKLKGLWILVEFLLNKDLLDKEFFDRVIIYTK